MATVSMKTKLGVRPEKVWELVGQFNALPDWHPAVEKSELEEGGQVRRLSLAGGASIVERLEQLDDSGRKYRYSISSGPLPVSDYVSEISVSPDGDGCSVEWSSEFQPAGAPEPDAVKAIQGVYQAGLDNLKKMFGG